MRTNPWRMYAAAAAVTISYPLAALAAAIPGDMREGYVQACRTFGAKDPSAPQDPAKLAKYCECVTDAYWDSVPQEELDGMLSEMQARTVDGRSTRAVKEQALKRRMAARQQCSGEPQPDSQPPAK